MESTDLDTIITRIRDNDSEIQYSALKALHLLISSTQGTVGIKQQDLYDRIQEFINIAKNMDGDNQRYLYDLISIMNLFHNDQNVLKYRLLGSYTSIADWGLQYVRKIVCCILDVIYQKLEIEDYTPLIKPITTFLFQHNAEIEAIDFIFEVSFQPLKNESHESLNTTFRNDYTDLIFDHIDKDNRDRIITYLEEMDKFYNIQDIMIRLYQSEPTRMLVYLLKINKINDAIEYVKSLSDSCVQKQCLYILARNCIYYESNDVEVRRILSNSFLSENFFNVATLLELLAPQKLEYIFKSLDKEKVESAAIANALVHFAFCRDPVFFPVEDDYHIKQEFSDSLRSHRSISVNASVGLIYSYSHERVLEYYSSMIYESPDIGAVLALAIASQKHHDLDSENIGLLVPFLSSSKKNDVFASMLGISILYSTSCSQTAYEAIFPLLSSSDVDVAFFAIYVLGSIFAGSADENIISACLDIYNEIKNNSPFCNLAILGISLIPMKTPEFANSEVFSKFDNYTKILSLGMMNIGTGNPKVVDEILSEAFTGDTDALLESLGLISSCIVGLGDNIATALIDRICNSSLLLDSPHLKNIFPLCFALLYPSNPKTEVIDVLEKSLFSGEADSNALISLGIVGAGTRSSRILRLLEVNYNNIYKDPRSMSSLIISQGLINMGKGLFTLSPFYYDRNVISNRSVIGLLSTVFLFIDQSLFPDFSYLCYALSSSISSKYITGIEGICRVGRPVDVVGLTGKPNKLSGSVVHSLPVILNTGEKAEIEADVATAFIEDVLVEKIK